MCVCVCVRVRVCVCVCQLKAILNECVCVHCEVRGYLQGSLVCVCVCVMMMMIVGVQTFNTNWTNLHVLIPNLFLLCNVLFILKCSTFVYSDFNWFDVKISLKSAHLHKCVC